MKSSTQSDTRYVTERDFELYMRTIYGNRFDSMFVNELKEEFFKIFGGKELPVEYYSRLAYFQSSKRFRDLLFKNSQTDEKIKEMMKVTNGIREAVKTALLKQHAIEAMIYLIKKKFKEEHPHDFLYKLIDEGIYIELFLKSKDEYVHRSFIFGVTNMRKPKSYKDHILKNNVFDHLEVHYQSSVADNKKEDAVNRGNYSLMCETLMKKLCTM